MNTDAEGRLVLADGLGLVRRHEPDMVVDVATLTGAMRVSLGDKITGYFASDPETSEKIRAAASTAGEHFWEMPLFRDYRKSLDSSVADIKNVSGSRYGGAITAALFLAEYAGDGSWAHLDIAGPALARENNGDMVKGASGVPVRTLVELARGGFRGVAVRCPTRRRHGLLGSQSISANGERYEKANRPSGRTGDDRRHAGRWRVPCGPDQ
jgi:leucyl aminopeptidase